MAWEQTDRYSNGPKANRLDRVVLFDYAQAVGLDLQQSLVERDFAHPTLIEMLSTTALKAFPIPSRDYEQEYQLARSIVGQAPEHDDVLLSSGD